MKRKREANREQEGGCFKDTARARIRPMTPDGTVSTELRGVAQGFSLDAFVHDELNVILQVGKPLLASGAQVAVLLHKLAGNRRLVFGRN